MSSLIVKVNNLPNSFSRFVQPSTHPFPWQGKTSKPPKSLVSSSLLSVNSSLHSSEMLYRRIGNSFVEVQYRDLIKEIHKRIIKLDINSPEYIKAVLELARFFCSAQPIETDINLSSRRLENIVNSNESCIFIMNHDYQAQDPVLMSIFGVLLYENYLLLGKAAICPRPKILLNKDILTSKDKRHRQIYEALGAIGVDIGNRSFSEAKKNAKVLLPVIQDFCKNKNHIFIFPEGRRAAFKYLDLRKKFQAGVGHMVRTASKIKDRVKVVPLGFAFNLNKSEGQPLSSICIGEPVYFKRDGKKMFASVGNVSFDEASDSYKKFFYENNPVYERFSDIPFTLITGNGAPVVDHTQPLYIADVLAENLQICRRIAINNLPKSSLKDEIMIV